LSDENALVRRASVSALSKLGKNTNRTTLKAASQPLLDRVKSESDDVVRKAALGTLATLAGPEHAGSAPDLYPLLEHADVELARGVAYVLGKMGGDAAKIAVPVLRDALRDPDTVVQALAAAVLANIGPDAVPAVDGLARVLSDAKDPIVRRNCAIALGRIGAQARSAVPALAAALKPVAGAPRDVAGKRRDEEVREQAAEALAQIRYPNNVAALAAITAVIIKDPNTTVRQRCVWVSFNMPLKEPGYQDLRKALEAVLSETGPGTLYPRYDIARAMAFALGSETPDKVCEVLLDMIGNTNIKVFDKTEASIESTPDERKGGSTGTTTTFLTSDGRYMAAEALGKLADKAKRNAAIVAALRKAAKDKEAKLKEKATEALKNLGLGE
jgi:HEAT repeat protein